MANTCCGCWSRRPWNQIVDCRNTEYNRGMQPLTPYVIVAAIVMVVAIGLAWLKGGKVYARSVTLAGLGYLLGMFAIYLAMHYFR
ncbi:MAG: hypothetical protein ACLPYB_04485 [Desulfobaccales bacterium]